MTKEELIAFEAEVARRYDNKDIRAPVHLSSGNEDVLIEVFNHIRPEDWIAVQWRSHYHCLLKGVPAGRLMADIIVGKSITLCYPEYRIISSAIVGGHLPIALGIAWSLKRAGEKGRVWAFLGDMTALGGTFHECREYATRQDLPIKFVVEDNGRSVCTPTDDAWGRTEARSDGLTWSYSYELSWPHAGAGTRVQF
jgi:TPP-dependent pyruvate/acetoin dehydrogenase alpha subunit